MDRVVDTVAELVSAFGSAGIRPPLACGSDVSSTAIISDNGTEFTSNAILGRADRNRSGGQAGQPQARASVGGILNKSVG